ncbi:synaptopodin 2-like protein [Megalops cyprinoides]|uniref:synaptopodin 2-like protein n=1 Tax=Megalops cyprinoides TaxID=118141 RepID=UPI001864AB78|nr:synaptopodin 2-like protein [Megalops cyprinoides]
MVAEEVVITLSGGAPWGFRLQGGAEHKKPLQVAKVRKRSKACRAGLREADELVSINESSCGELSHAQAMNLIDSTPGTLHIRVRRAPAGFQSVVLLTRAPSPRIDKEYRAALRAMTPPASKPPQATVREVHQAALVSPGGRSRVTSPPGSEAYYGETDSDADIVHEKQRRQKRRSPSSSPGKTSGRASPEETSEMSGYDSAPDALAQGPGGPPEAVPGVARREVVYQPTRGEWSSHTETSTENSSVSTDDQNPRDGATEEDSGFQEPQSLPPLVSPERAKEALLLASRKQLVPMVGPVDNPVDEELTVTYMDKAKQAKLNRGDSVQDKQVKEARTKCRTIASLLTDAPNPHSKGVLMFKKRRQRSKKYTLTSFGSVDEDIQQDSHEEDGVFPGSESEFDEDGFAASTDPTWDSDYLDILEKKTPAGTAGDEAGGTESPGLTATSGKGAKLFEQQRRRAAEHAKRAAARQAQAPPPPQPTETPAPPAEAEPPPAYIPTPAPPPGFAVMNGDSVAAHGESVVAPPPAVAPKPASPPALPVTPLPQLPLAQLPDSPTAQLPDLPSSSVLNRTARPFAPGFITHRAATAPVVFRPSVAKKTRPATTPAAAPPPFSSLPSEAKPAVLPTSPHLTARPTPVSALPAASSPPSSVPVDPFSPSPTPAAPVLPSMPSPAVITPSAPSLPLSPQVSAAPAPAVAAPVTPTPMPRAHREQRALGLPGRTGILEDARRRSTTKPMFQLPKDKKNSPNPELLSMVQCLDVRSKAGPEVGFESSPDEDFFNLGAEACNFMQGPKGKMPPPVAPKPRVIPEMPHIPQMEGKGAKLFARRQSRMDQYVVDNAPQQPAQPAPAAQPRAPSPAPSLPAHWKYSPNIRAPPPIGYNPLLSPSCPPGAQRGVKAADASKAGKKGGPHKEGIKAVDVMRRQPYQLNSAMFSFGGSPAHSGSSYQSTMHRHGGQMVGSSLTSPRQIPVKAARVYEIKRFSTPTPMSAPTTLTPTVIAPRSATTLGEPLCDSVSPPPAQSPPTSPPSASQGALPQLPKISTAPIPSSLPPPAPARVPGLGYGSLQAAKQFKSAPELSPLPVRAAGLQAPKPRFVASRMGIQANVWRPGSMHH